MRDVPRFLIAKLSLLMLVILMAGAQTACALFAKPKPTQQVLERVLKKKIVMTGFAVNVPAQVQDLDDIAQGLPREMLSRLENSGSYLIRQSKNLLSYELKQEAPSAKLVQQIAAENDAQFVVAGEVRSAAVRSDKKYFGLWETRSRHIEIEFALYDGISGALLNRHHLYRPAFDDANIGRDKPFGSVAFFATNYGKAIDSLLAESVAWIRKDLAAYPMMAKIIQVNDGQFVLDAGATSNLLAGDQGLVVTELEQLPALGLNSQQARPLHYGTPLATLGKMKLSQSQLQFAVGEVVGTADEQLVKVRVGDFVRFDVVR